MCEDDVCEDCVYDGPSINEDSLYVKCVCLYVKTVSIFEGSVC